jgi:hypothetical protein
MKRIDKEFSELDISLVDFNTGEWTITRGGSPFHDLDWSINHLLNGEGDVIEFRYRLPRILSVIIGAAYLQGADDVRDAVGAAIQSCKPGLYPSRPLAQERLLSGAPWPR